MNISGIGSYSGNYNSIKINSLLRQQEQKPVQQVHSSGDEDSVRRQQEQQQIRQRQNFNSGDYAKQYEPERNYDLKGSDSDIASLDEATSASGSQKTQIMKQYQLFMGETQAQGTNQAAMNTRAVRGVENFAF